MAVDLPTFRVAFPEFDSAPDSLVTAHLNYAITRVDPTVWGNFLEEGTFLWTAKFLAMSPFARKMGLVSGKDGGQTAYDLRLDQLKRAVASGYRVT